MKSKCDHVRSQGLVIQAHISARLGIKIKFDIVFERYKPARHGQPIAIFLEVLAHLRRELIEMLKHRIRRAILFD